MRWRVACAVAAPSSRLISQQDRESLGATSFEPDLLFDVDSAEGRADALVDVLKERDYHRTRTHRWSKELRIGVAIEIDLFRPDDSNESFDPAGLTPVDATVALARTREIRVAIKGRHLVIRVPDAVGFLAMKIDAKTKYRAEETKDCFDIAAYVSLIGRNNVAKALDGAGSDGVVVRKALRALFGTTTSPGVADVLSNATTLSDDERALVAQGLVDLIGDI